MPDDPLISAIEKLKNHIISEDYRGYDPYDTLVSPIFKYPPFNSGFLRFGFQQVCKRIPFSLRAPLRIRKGLNPVSLGLSIQAYSYLINILPRKSSFFHDEINRLIDLLIMTKSEGYSGCCWGYNFDWEARYTRIDAYIPTSVATADITNGLFECYRLTGNQRAFDLCEDATRFVLNDLNKSYQGDVFCYSYSPVDNQCILNSSMKAAKLLSQVYSINKDVNLIREAKKAVTYVVESQIEDGHWPYARHDARSWADNYHSGYVLDCLDSYIKNSQDFHFTKSLNKGLSFYISNFIKDDQIPKFYYNKLYPIDSTAIAQSLLTLSRFNYLDTAEKVATWSIQHMQAKEGGFYYRKHKYLTDKNIFMRWSNAWMFVGLSYFHFRKMGLE